MGTCNNLLMILELLGKRTREETPVYLDPVSLSSNSQVISGLQAGQYRNRLQSSQQADPGAGAVTWDAAEFLLSPQPPQRDCRPSC